MYLNHSPVTFLANISCRLDCHLAQDIFHVLLCFSLFFCFLLCFWTLFLCFGGIVLGSFRMLVLLLIVLCAADGCLWTKFVSLFVGWDLLCLLVVMCRSNRRFVCFMGNLLGGVRFIGLHFRLVHRLIIFIQEFTPFLKNYRFRFHKNYYIFCTFKILFLILNYLLMVDCKICLNIFRLYKPLSKQFSV